MKKGHFEWSCSTHNDCKPGSGEWRAAMAKLLGFNLHEHIDDVDGPFELVCERLDKQQLCPMCVMDLQDVAKESPKRSVQIALDAAKKRIEDLEKQLESTREGLAPVLDFIKKHTGQSPHGGSSVGHTPCGGQMGGFSDRLSNLLYEAVNKRVNDILAKRGEPALEPTLTKVVSHYPGDDCPWLELHDQDGKELCRVEYDDQPNDAMDKVAKAICGAAGIETEGIT